MPTNKPEVVLPDWAIAAAFRELDNCQNHSDKECGVYNEIFNRALEKHRADTLTRPADGDFVMAPVPDAPPLPAWLIDACQSKVWAAAWETLSKHMLSAARQQHGQEVVGTPYRCDYCGADYGARACCDMRYEYLRKFGENILPPLSAQQPVEAVAERLPDGYVYRYPDGSIRHSSGREINGMRPVESIPYFYRSQPPAIDIGKLREGIGSVRNHFEYMKRRYAISTQARVACDDGIAEINELAALIGDGGKDGAP